MKNYALFVWFKDDGPKGGWDDFVEFFDKLDEAYSKVHHMLGWCKRPIKYQIVDVNRGKAAIEGW